MQFWLLAAMRMANSTGHALNVVIEVENNQLVLHSLTGMERRQCAYRQHASEALGTG